MSTTDAIEAIFPLAPMQEGMVFHALQSPGTALYHEQLSVPLEGDLDPGAFARAWSWLAERHAVLRTAFAWKSPRQMLQVVQRRAALVPRCEDWRALHPPAQEERLAAFLEADRREGFDLARAPLTRVALLRTGERSWQLVWSIHHALVDGWSSALLLAELLEAYQALRTGRTPELPPVRPFRDFVSWLQRRDASGDEAFWRAALAGFAEPTPLVMARAAGRPGAPHATESLRLSSEATAALQRLAREERLTPATLVQGAFALLLARYAGQDDVLFGATVSGRPAELQGVERMVGLFINTIPVRARLERAAPAAAWLRGLQEAQLSARQHEHAPLVRIRGWAEVPARSPLFESLLVFENYPFASGLRRPGGPLRFGSPRTHSRTNYPLTVTAALDPELVLGALHDTSRLDGAAVRRMLRHLANLLEALAAQPGAPLGALPLLSGGERRAIEGWSRGAPAAPGLSSAPQLLAARAAERPDALAAETPAERLTYRELSARAHRLARHLAARGLRPGEPVGLCLEPGANLVVAMAGVLEAGGAFLPLDPASPPQRLAFILAEARPALVLAERATLGRLPASDAAAIVIDGEDAAALAREEAVPLGRAIAPGDPAYVIYTSGSTGEPKGAVLHHGGLCNFAAAFVGAAALGPNDRVLQFASPSFDASVAEVWSTFAAGAALVVPPREVRASPRDLERFLVEARITSATFPPSLLAVLSPEAVPGLRSVVTAGEACPVEVARRWSRGRRLVNFYGPTETSIGAAWHLVGELPADAAGVPIGRPVAGGTCWVLGPDLAPVPAGVPGELCVGGAGVGLGYLGRPALTAERFVRDPFEPGRRLYRTGDRARWSAEGALEFLGRLDDQLKVRGFRIEPGEVEAALTQHPALAAAAVAARADGQGEAQLVAWVLPRAGATAPGAAELRRHLRGRLPEWMVPARFVAVSELPVNASGKVDRRRLPDPDARSARHVAPRTPVEEVLCALFAHVLGVERVGVEDDFFALGGHSLKATQLAARVRDALGAELPLQAIFETPTVAALASVAGEKRPVAAPPILPRPAGEPRVASFAQQRLWFLEELAPGTPRHNIPAAVRLAGSLAPAALARALAALVRRHEVLRTRLAPSGGLPVPVVDEDAEAPLPVEDLSCLEEPAREARLRERLAELAREPLDLAAGPVLRARLLRLSPEEHVLSLVVHHAATDGWSMGVAVRELGALYQAAVAGRPAELAPLPLQYADYARWQRAWLQGDALEEQLGYWRERLRGAPPLLALPTDRPRPPVATDRGGHVRFLLPEALLRPLWRVGRAEGATPFMTLLAAFQVLLGRLAGQEDVSVGTPIANRTRAELEGLVGFFANTLVLRGDLGGDPTFRDLVARTRAAALGAYAHQDVPFEMVVEALQPRRALSHSPLFQVMFVLDDTPREPLRLPGLTLAPLEAETGSAAFDLTLALAAAEGGLDATLEYNADLFDAATAERIAAQLRTLLAGIAADPDRRISALPLLGDDERRRLTSEWAAAPAPEPADRSFAARFARQAAAAPDAVALTFQGRAVSYGELDRRAEHLARRLARRGAGPGALVGVSAERSVEAVVAALGVMKAGGCYLPLDPAYPAQRLAFMVEDSRVALLVTQPHLAARLPGIASVVLVDDPAAEEAGGTAEALLAARAPGPEDVAYAIYTSGSTGKPKAALLKHRGLVNLSEAQREAFGVGPGSRVLQFSPFSFDASVWELAMALGNGATLCLAPQEVLASSIELTALLREQRITHVTLPPSVLAVLAPEELPELGTVISAGEACTRKLVERWAPGRRFWNAYGPTETTVCATMGPCSAEDARPPSIGKPIANARAYVLDARPPSIGKPIANARAYVLDARQRPVPVGVPGELCIGGVGVARGYLHRPELTVERFLPDPFQPGGRLYRTGDLARWRADGTIEFLGRIDQQVKVRGFRIEPAEVEAALRRHPAVRECVVLAREDRPGEARLVAYVEHGDAPAPSAAELKAAVRAELPEHMLPTGYVCLAKLPLSPSGKVDRAALPAPEARSERAYVAPRTEVEEKLAELCAGLLGVERVGVEDDFFELGGHSLLATQLLSRVRDAFDVELPLRVLFEGPSIAQLAQAVETARAGRLDAAELAALVDEVEALPEEPAAAQGAGEAGERP
ncbi:non-ribosomal peptide synthetase [Anaeromyxobacter diazotrophicus]|uniref:Carrier domain-containing protein n=1 Tax=Anaeromyxobacter diazotrophicus TaxID=2590199 RepID=A0A7I9VNS6_9BACT|nr:non-ribosomal peptide synthetase [Anaeromyxobacter diazotrophicus]GEJ57769.1 hypothetical protein AMYX_25100 [Anaeromyxobacter diazotrophicus]